MAKTLVRVEPVNVTSDVMQQKAAGKVGKTGDGNGVQGTIGLDSSCACSIEMFVHVHMQQSVVVK